MQIRTQEVNKAGLKASALIIMRKISDFDIVKEAFEEIHSEYDVESDILDKTAFDIGVSPGAIVGAITGAAIANKKTQAEIFKRQMENDNSKVIQGNYYSQVQNIAENLKVIFTPFGAVYVVKNGNREITIETIQTEEMNVDMYKAWQARDAMYYKNLLLNKMHSEIQFVEQQFAKNIIEKQMGMQNKFNKHASENSDIDTSNMTLTEVYDHIAKTKDLYSKNTDVTNKLAELLVNELDDGSMFKISWTLDRPFDKYAGLGNPLSFLGFQGNGKDIKALQGNYLNPSYLVGKVKVSFMPDRVLFVVDNKVITSLLAIDMNHDGFEHFKEQDQKYFVKYFEQQAKVGKARIDGKAMPPKNIPFEKQEKNASNFDVSQIFNRSDIHPGIYFMVLSKQYGVEWMSFDSHALIKIIEKDYNLDEGIDDIALNIILSIQAANNGLAIYESNHAFEKIIRSFANKPVDFFSREISDLTIRDIAFGIDMLDRVTPHDDIYDNFSPEVLHHIVEILMQQDNRVYLPSKITGSPTEPHFNTFINRVLLENTNQRDINRIADETFEKAVLRNNEVIARAALGILSALKKKAGTDQIGMANALVDKLTTIPDDLREAVRVQVINNVNLDTFLSQKEKSLQEQLKFFKLV